MGSDHQGALAEAMREAVQSRRGVPAGADRDDRPARSREDVDGGRVLGSAGDVVLIDDSDLPPIERRRRVRRDFVTSLGELPHGWLWKSLWLLLREAVLLVGLFWAAVLVSGFAVPALGAPAAAGVALGLRVALQATVRAADRLAQATPGH